MSYQKVYNGPQRALNKNIESLMHANNNYLQSSLWSKLIFIYDCSSGANAVFPFFFLTLLSVFAFPCRANWISDYFACIFCCSSLMPSSSSALLLSNFSTFRNFNLAFLRVSSSISSVAWSCTLPRMILSLSLLSLGDA